MDEVFGVKCKPVKDPAGGSDRPSGDFVLKKHILDLMAWVRELGAEEIKVTIEVANGLPVHWFADGTRLFFEQ